MKLTEAIIRVNADTVKVLENVSVWRFHNPLPALQLDLFVSNHTWPNSLTNVRCSTDVDTNLPCYSFHSARFASSNGAVHIVGIHTAHVKPGGR